MDKPLSSQVWELKEDLFQVQYFDAAGNRYILDVGWYPEFELTGFFKIILVKNYTWDNPMLVKSCGIQDLYDILKHCIEKVNSF